MQKKMTSGSPLQLLLGFTIPMMGGLLFQQFYNMADTIIVGRCLGVQKLAAVGATGSIHFMIIGFCNGVCNGCGIPVAQEFGAGKENQMRKYIANSIYLCSVLALVLTAVMLGSSHTILQWMGTPEDIFESAYQYVFFMMLGIPAAFLYNLGASFLRALGDSRRPVYFLIISSILNIVLDLFMILVLHMGVAGAALATVIAQGCSGGMIFAYLYWKSDILKLSKEEWKQEHGYIKRLFGMGIPMGIQYSITGIGSVVLQTCVNTLGSGAVAAVTAGSKIHSVFNSTYEALGSAVATYTGQNIGAGKLERVRKGLKSALIMGWVYGVAAFLICLFLGKSIISMFIHNPDMELMQKSWLFIMVNSGLYFFVCIVNTVRNAVQGMGYSKIAMFAGVFELAARALAGLYLIPRVGYAAACLANPLAWMAADLFLTPVFFKCLKKEKYVKGSYFNG